MMKQINRRSTEIQNRNNGLEHLMNAGNKMRWPNKRKKPCLIGRTVRRLVSQMCYSKSLVAVPSAPHQVQRPPRCRALPFRPPQPHPQTHVHSITIRRIRNMPLVPSFQTRAPNYQKDNGNMYRLNQVGRSASAREFRTLNQ